MKKLILLGAMAALLCGSAMASNVAYYTYGVFSGTCGVGCKMSNPVPPGINPGSNVSSLTLGSGSSIDQIAFVGSDLTSNPLDPTVQPNQSDLGTFYDVSNTTSTSANNLGSFGFTLYIVQTQPAAGTGFIAGSLSGVVSRNGSGQWSFTAGQNPISIAGPVGTTTSYAVNFDATCSTAAKDCIVLPTAGGNMSCNSVLKTCQFVAGNYTDALGNPIVLKGYSYTGSSSPWRVSGKDLQADVSQVNVVPEPASLALFGSGLSSLAMLIRRRARKAA